MEFEKRTITDSCGKRNKHIMIYCNFRLIIAGTRYFNDYELLKNTADKLLANKIKKGCMITIVSGGCKGADLLGEQYAIERGYNIARYPAQWSVYGKSAGIRRNEEMAKNADGLIAFWDGQSKGTRNMIEEAKKKGIAIRIKMY